MKSWISSIIGLAMLSSLAMLSACASYSGSSLVPGTASVAEVRQLMGEPAAIHKAASRQDKASSGPAVESWEYPRGPAGRHTYMVRFDAGGKVTAIDQVLTVAQTAKIAWGQATRDDVRALLGRPGTVYPVRNGGEMWDYAALSEGLPRPIRLVVSFDAGGRAVAGGESYDHEEWSPNADGGSSTN